MKNKNINIIEGEVWKPIEGYEEFYEISNLGRVKSKRKFKYTFREILLSPVIRSGYYVVGLYDSSKKCKMHLLHRLIAIAFIPKIIGKNTINHIDGNKLNNSIDNLEWCTQPENVEHARRTGLMKEYEETHHNASLTNKQVLEIYHSNLSHKELSYLYKVSQGVISKIKTGAKWSTLTNAIYKKTVEKLTPQIALSIYNSPLTYQELQEKYGLCKATISGIKVGRSWSEVTGKKHIPIKWKNKQLSSMI